MEALDVRLGAALAWIDLHYAGRRLAALDSVLQTLEPLWDAAPAGVTAGATRPAGALTPVAQRAALDDRRSELVAALGVECGLGRRAGPSTRAACLCLRRPPGRCTG